MKSAGIGEPRPPARSPLAPVAGAVNPAPAAPKATAGAPRAIGAERLGTAGVPPVARPEGAVITTPAEAMAALGEISRGAVVLTENAEGLAGTLSKIHTYVLQLEAEISVLDSEAGRIGAELEKSVPKGEHDRVRKEYDDLQTRRGELAKRLAPLRAEIGDLESQIKKAEASKITPEVIEELRRRTAGLDARTAQVRLQIESLKKEREQADAAISDIGRTFLGVMDAILPVTELISEADALLAGAAMIIEPLLTVPQLGEVRKKLGTLKAIIEMARALKLPERPEAPVATPTPAPRAPAAPPTPAPVAPPAPRPAAPAPAPTLAAPKPPDVAPAPMPSEAPPEEWKNIPEVEATDWLGKKFTRELYRMTGKAKALPNLSGEERHRLPEALRVRDSEIAQVLIEIAEEEASQNYRVFVWKIHGIVADLNARGRDEIFAPLEKAAGSAETFGERILEIARRYVVIRKRAGDLSPTRPAPIPSAARPTESAAREVLRSLIGKYYAEFEKVSSEAQIGEKITQILVTIGSRQLYLGLGPNIVADLEFLSRHRGTSASGEDSGGRLVKALLNLFIVGVKPGEDLESNVRGAVNEVVRAAEMLRDGGNLLFPEKLAGGKIEVKHIVRDASNPDKWIIQSHERGYHPDAVEMNGSRTIIHEMKSSYIGEKIGQAIKTLLDAVERGDSSYDPAGSEAHFAGPARRLVNQLILMKGLLESGRIHGAVLHLTSSDVPPKDVVEGILGFFAARAGDVKILWHPSLYSRGLNLPSDSIYGGGPPVMGFSETTGEFRIVIVGGEAQRIPIAEDGTAGKPPSAAMPVEDVDVSALEEANHGPEESERTQLESDLREWVYRREVFINIFDSNASVTEGFIGWLVESPSAEAQCVRDLREKDLEMLGDEEIVRRTTAAARYWMETDGAGAAFFAPPPPVATRHPSEDIDDRRAKTRSSQGVARFSGKNGIDWDQQKTQGILYKDIYGYLQEMLKSDVSDDKLRKEIRSFMTDCFTSSRMNTYFLNEVDGPRLIKITKWFMWLEGQAKKRGDADTLPHGVRHAFFEIEKTGVRGIFGIAV